MTTTHKTFTGMVRAAERLIADLQSSPATDDREYKGYSKRYDAIAAELRSLWSNPADSAEAETLANRLRDAWNGQGY